MRILRCLLIVGLALGLAGPAWALYLQGYNSGDPLTFHFNSLDVGASYQYGTHLGVAACDANTISGPAGGQGNEDAWGIARVTNITDPSNSVTYWDAGTSGTEITAIFFGIVDQSISYSQLIPTSDRSISYSQGFKFMMFEDPAINWNPNQGPLARAGALNYPTVTDGTLLLEAVGVMGILDTLQTTPGNPVWATHSADAILNWDSAAHNFVIGVQNGSGHAFADIADVDGDTVATGWQYAGGLFSTSNPLVNADIRLDWTLWPPGAVPTNPPPVGGVWWDLSDSDPVQMSYIPEPVTMAGLLLGIGCLGRYIRRRR